VEITTPQKRWTNRIQNPELEVKVKFHTPLKVTSTITDNRKSVVQKRATSRRKHGGKVPSSSFCPPAPYNTTSYIIDFHRSEVKSFGLPQKVDELCLLDVNDLEMYDTSRFVRCKWEENPYDVQSVVDIED
jgi:hypothetical protein